MLMTIPYHPNQGFPVSARTFDALMYRRNFAVPESSLSTGTGSPMREGFCRAWFSIDCLQICSQYEKFSQEYVVLYSHTKQSKSLAQFN